MVGVPLIDHSTCYKQIIATAQQVKTHQSFQDYNFFGSYDFSSFFDYMENMFQAIYDSVDLVSPNNAMVIDASQLDPENQLCAGNATGNRDSCQGLGQFC